MAIGIRDGDADQRMIGERAAHGLLQIRAVVETAAPRDPEVLVNVR